MGSPGVASRAISMISWSDTLLWLFGSDDSAALSLSCALAARDLYHSLC